MRARRRRKQIDGTRPKAYRWRMFRRTSPQRPLFGVEHRLEKEKRARLEKTWAQPYRTKALGLIDENRLRVAVRSAPSRAPRCAPGVSG